MIAPMPPYEPESIIWKSSCSSSGTYTVYGSRASSMASMPARSMRLTSSEST